MSISDRIRAGPKSRIGLCHVCHSSGVLVGIHDGITTCATCADHLTQPGVRRE